MKLTIFIKPIEEIHDSAVDQQNSRFCLCMIDIGRNVQILQSQ